MLDAYDPRAQLDDISRVMHVVREELSHKRAAFSLPDGSVIVEVDGNGDIRKLGLARGSTRSIPVNLLGAGIRDAINGARSEAARRSQRLVVNALNDDEKLASHTFKSMEEY